MLTEEQQQLATNWANQYGLDPNTILSDAQYHLSSGMSFDDLVNMVTEQGRPYTPTTSLTQEPTSPTAPYVAPTVGTDDVSKNLLLSGVGSSLAAPFLGETAAGTALGSLGGVSLPVGPLQFGPFGPLTLASAINSWFSSRGAADELERQKMYQAREEMAAAGIDPFEIYSPMWVAEQLASPADADRLASLYPGNLIQDYEAGLVNPEDISAMLGWDAVQQFMRDPSRAPSTTVNSFAPTDYVGDVVDTATDIWNDPSRLLGVILGPGGVTGNIKWGNDDPMANMPGTSTAVYTGSPAERVYTGVSTGFPAVDAAIRKVLGQTTGGETTTMDVIAETVQQETGWPMADIIDILKGVFDERPSGAPSPTSTSTSSTSPSSTTPTSPDKTGTTVETDSGLIDKVIDLIRGKKDKDEDSTSIYETLPTQGTGDLPTATINFPVGDGVVKNPEEVINELPRATINFPTGDNVIEGGGGILEGGGGILEGGGGVLETVGDAGDILESANDTGPLETVGEDILEVIPPSVLDGLLGLVLPQMNAGLRAKLVDESPLAVIEYLYDIGGDSIFAPVLEGEASDDSERLARINRLGGVPYAEGGTVDIVELAKELLRG